MKQKISFRRAPRPIPSKFFEHKYIGGPKNHVRYLYIGKTIIRIRRYL